MKMGISRLHDASRRMCIVIVVHLIGSTIDAMESRDIHILLDGPKNKLCFKTDRLRAYPFQEQSIGQMASLLNEPIPCQLDQINGCFYEDGSIKDQKWIDHKIQLIGSDFQLGWPNWRFFYLKEDKNQEQLVGFIGSEYRYGQSQTERGPDLTLVWGFSIPFQGQGYATEAMYGFLKFDLTRWIDPTADCIVSIHPENIPSCRFVEKIFKESWTQEKGWNFTKTQPRLFYRISHKNLDIVVRKLVCETELETDFYLLDSKKMNVE